MLFLLGQAKTLVDPPTR